MNRLHSSDAHDFVRFFLEPLRTTVSQFRTPEQRVEDVLCLLEREGKRRASPLASMISSAWSALGRIQVSTLR